MYKSIKIVNQYVFTTMKSSYNSFKKLRTCVEKVHLFPLRLFNLMSRFPTCIQNFCIGIWNFMPHYVLDMGRVYYIHLLSVN